MLLDSFHRLDARVTVVELVGGTIVVDCGGESRNRTIRSDREMTKVSRRSFRNEREGRKRTSLGKDDDVLSTTEGIGEVGGGAEEDIRVATLGLTSRRSIKVPLFQVLERLDGLGESLQGRVE